MFFKILPLLITCLLSANDFGHNEKAPDISNNNFDIALKKYNNKEYSAAASMFWDLSLNGNKASSVYLGKIFTEGLDIDQDCRKGLFFTFVAIKENICDANKNLAGWLITGICVKKDPIKAQKYEDAYKKCIGN